MCSISTLHFSDFSSGVQANIGVCGIIHTDNSIPAQPRSFMHEQKHLLFLLHCLLFISSSSCQQDDSSASVQHVLNAQLSEAEPAVSCRNQLVTRERSISCPTSSLNMSKWLGCLGAAPHNTGGAFFIILFPLCPAEERRMRELGTWHPAKV